MEAKSKKAKIDLSNSERGQIARQRVRAKREQA